MILVDSNVLIDVIENDPVWQFWSSEQIEMAAKAGQVVVNQVVLAEAAPRSGPLDQFRGHLELMMIGIESISDEAAYLAGAVFQRYRKRRLAESPPSILADFLIGGHAEVLGAKVLTRDPRFYRTYFPDVSLITPDRDLA